MIPIAIYAATLPDHADLHEMKCGNAAGEQDIHKHSLSLDPGAGRDKEWDGRRRKAALHGTGRGPVQLLCDEDQG
jgi:hypothetical protein